MYQSMIITLKRGETIHAGALFFYETLGLPCKGEPVIGVEDEVCDWNNVIYETTTGRRRQFLREVATDCGLVEVPKQYLQNLGKMKNQMLLLPQGGPGFKKIFVLFAFYSFLAPRTDKIISWEIVEALFNADRIYSHDWCSYIAADVCHNISELKKDISSGKVKGNVRYDYNCGGCIFALMIGYFHNVLPGEAIHSDIPFIQYWDDDLLHSRIDLDMNNLGVATLKKENEKGHTIKVTQPLIKRVEEKSAEADVGREVVEGETNELQITQYEGVLPPKRKRVEDVLETIDLVTKRFSLY